MVILCTLITSAAQLLWKSGASTLPAISASGIASIAAGFFLYGIGAGLLVYALTGGDLVVLYPMIATSYIWVNLFAWVLFGEQPSIIKWVGIVSIIVGLAFIGRGEQ